MKLKDCFMNFDKSHFCLFHFPRAFDDDYHDFPIQNICCWLSSLDSMHLRQMLKYIA